MNMWFNWRVMGNKDEGMGIVQNQIRNIISNDKENVENLQKSIKHEVKSESLQSNVSKNRKRTALTTLNEQHIVHEKSQRCSCTGCKKVIYKNDKLQKVTEVCNTSVQKSDCSHSTSTFLPMTWQYEKPLSFTKTPADCVRQPPSPKQVKVLHKKPILIKVSTSDITTHETAYHLQYLDEHIKVEREKDIRMTVRLQKEKRPSTEQWIILLNFLVQIYTKSIKSSELNLIALSSMWIALKKDGVSPIIPTLRRLLSFIKDVNENHRKRILELEIDILMELKFNIIFSDPFSTLSLCLLYADESKEALLYYCSSYVIDLSHYDTKLCVYSSITLALAAFQISLLIMTNEQSFFDVTLEMDVTVRSYAMTKSLTIDAIESVIYLRRKLFKMVSSSVLKDSPYHVIYKRYREERYGNISGLVAAKIRSISCNNNNNNESL